MGKKLEVWAFGLSILSLVLIAFLGYETIQQQGEIIDLQKEETDFNQVMNLYEISKDILKDQQGIIDDPESCINKSIVFQNQELLNDATSSLQKFDLNSTKNFLQKMDLTTCYEEEMMKKGLSGIWLLLIVLIAGLTLFIIAHKTKKKK